MPQSALFFFIALFSARLVFAEKPSSEENCNVVLNGVAGEVKFIQQGEWSSEELLTVLRRLHDAGLLVATRGAATFRDLRFDDPRYRAAFAGIPRKPVAGRKYYSELRKHFKLYGNALSAGGFDVHAFTHAKVLRRELEADWSEEELLAVLRSLLQAGLPVCVSKDKGILKLKMEDPIYREALKGIARKPVQPVTFYRKLIKKFESYQNALMRAGFEPAALEAERALEMEENERRRKLGTKWSSDEIVTVLKNLEKAGLPMSSRAARVLTELSVEDPVYLAAVKEIPKRLVAPTIFYEKVLDRFGGIAEALREAGIKRKLSFWTRERVIEAFQHIARLRMPNYFSGALRHQENGSEKWRLLCRLMHRSVRIRALKGLARRYFGGWAGAVQAAEAATKEAVARKSIKKGYVDKELSKEEQVIAQEIVRRAPLLPPDEEFTPAALAHIIAPTDKLYSQYQIAPILEQLLGDEVLWNYYFHKPGHKNDTRE